MNVLRKFTIRQVIVGIMGALSLVSLFAIGMLLVAALQSRATLERQWSQMLLDQRTADEIVQRATSQLDAAHRFTHTGDTSYLSRFYAEGEAVYDSLSSYRIRTSRTGEKLLVERIREQHETLEVDAQRVFAEFPAAAADLPGADSLKANLAALLRLREAHNAEVLEQQRRAWWWVYAACALTGLVFLAALYTAATFLQRRLLEPISALSAAMDRVGAGDFEARVHLPGNDELARVAASVNHMAADLQHARDERTRAEHRFRDLVEGLSTVVWEANAADLSCVYASPQAVTMFGFPIEDWHGTGIWARIIHPDDYGSVVADCLAASETGDDHVLEYRAITAAGEVLWVRDFVRVLVEDGRPARLRGVLTDITESRASAEALRLSEERYHSLFDRVPVGLYRSTPDGTLVDVNTAFVQMLGYPSREALLAANARDIYATDSRAEWRDLLDGTDGVVEVDREHRRYNGEVIWLRDTARAVRGEDGAVRYYEGAMQDVTERIRAEESVRRSEARFRSLIENASDGVLILSSDGRIMYQSPAVERMLGYTAAESIGRQRLHVVHEDDRERVAAQFAELAANAERARSFELRCVASNGSIHIIHAIATNLLHDPAVGGFVINMVDLTDNRELQSQLEHAQKMEAVGRLAGGIAHDFNNLLTAIQGYADLLRDRVSPDSEDYGDLMEIRRATETAARLTNHLLAFSRRQVVQPRSTDVTEIVHALELMLRRLITADVQLSTSVVPGMWVHADPGHVEQVVLNLVVNARDAVPVTRINVSVEGRRVAAGEVSSLDAGEYVVISVVDDGCGIPADVLPHIFEPFFTTKDVGKGTGLGLATVYGIVQECGGHLEVRSQPGHGTAIIVYLPRIGAPTAALPVPEEASAGPGPATVLLVEDEPSVRALARRVLEREGYRVLCAGNGVEALSLVRNDDREIDLLVTDVVMPVMGGVPLAAELLSIRPETPILFISGYTAEMLPAADAAGRPLNFLEKPFAAADLLGAVAGALAGEPAGHA